MDSKKFLEALKKPLIISLIFNILVIAISFVISFLIAGAYYLPLDIITGNPSASTAAAGIATILALFSLLLAGLVYVGNIAIYIYTGHNSAKTHGVKLIDCGIISMACFAVTFIITTVISTILSLIYYAASAISSPLTPLFGAASIGIGLILGIFWFFGGVFINFFLGLIGGLIGGAK